MARGAAAIRISLPRPHSTRDMAACFCDSAANSQQYRDTVLTMPLCYRVIDKQPPAPSGGEILCWIVHGFYQRELKRTLGKF